MRFAPLHANAEKLSQPAQVKMPQIKNIGDLPERRHSSHYGHMRPTRLLDRLWPKPDWEVEAKTDPWGTALRHAFRSAADIENIVWREEEAKQDKLTSWVKRARATRRVADRLCGQDALTWIAEGFRSDDSGRVIRARNQAERRPFEISANALLIACVGYRRRCRLDIITNVSGSGIHISLIRLKGRMADSWPVCSPKTLEAAIAAAHKLPLARRLKPPSAHRRIKVPGRWYALHPFRVYPTDSGCAVGFLTGPKDMRRRILIQEFASVEEAESALRKPKTIHPIVRATYRWYHQAANPSTRAHQLRRSEKQRAKRKAVRRWEDPRGGPPRRGGDVSAADFYAAFRPRCLYFEESVSQRQRQRIVNRLYDCASDLAELLDIPPTDLFLYRRISVSIGTLRRGQRTITGLYTPAGALITLHPARGGGVLPHEWFHALDYHTPKTQDDPLPLLYTQLTLSGKIARAVEQAAIDGMPTYRERSEQKDLRWGRASEISTWSRESEMGARAFEALMRVYSLKRNWCGTPCGALSPFEEARRHGRELLYPYPTRDELTRCGDEILALVREAAGDVIERQQREARIVKRVAEIQLRAARAA